MKRFLILLTIFLVASAAFAVDWQTNPVFLRGVDKNTIFTSYRATFGSGDLANKSHSLGFNSYETHLRADKDIYSHSLYVGYVNILSPDMNFGVFATHDLLLGDVGGTFYQVPTNALANYYIDRYASESRNNTSRIDLVLAREVSDKVAYGASFNFVWTDSANVSTYDTLDTDALSGGRNAKYTEYKNKYYFGGTAGLAYVPTKNLELDFAIEAGGYFGDNIYKEDIFNYTGSSETYTFDNEGDLNGFFIRGEIDGSYLISKKANLPFMFSYTFENGLEDYGGFGTYDGVTVSPYYKHYDQHYRSHTIKAGAGLNYAPTKNVGIYAWGYYKYYTGLSNIYSLSDEHYAGFNISQMYSDIIYNNHTIGLSVGVSYAVNKDFILSTGVNYNYTFINLNQVQENYRNLGLWSWYDYTGNGYSEYLDLKFAAYYTMKNFKFGIVTMIPLVADSSYDLGGTNSANMFLPDPIRSASDRRDYSIILTLSYSF